ncbi:MAG: thymidylate synthase, partial [Candidatus Pacearchaeota archaeon]
MRQYHELLKDILVNGDVQYDPRTEEQVLGISGHLSKYNMSEGFPLVTTKKVAPRLVFEELFWKMRGERNVKPLYDRKVHIWDGNAFDHYLKRHGLKGEVPKHTEKWEEEFKKYKEKIGNDSEFAAVEGDMGPIYGYQWRHWKKQNGEEIDQLKKVLKGIKEKPGSRYHVMSAWNVGELEEMALGPCPFWHQFTVYGDNLDLHTVQRSCDVYLGVPFNIAQESALLYTVAKETGLKPRKFIHDYINVHIYLG